MYLAAVSVAAMLVLSPQTGQQEAINGLIVQPPSLNDTSSKAPGVGVILPKLLALPGVAKVDVFCLPSPESPLLQQVVNADPHTGIAMQVVAETADAVAALRERLRAELPDSRITPGDAFGAIALRPLHAIRGLMLVILGLLGATLCASVGFTMGARLKPTGEAVGLLHLLGADEATLVPVIVLNTVWSALWAAVSGAVAALFTFAVVAGLAGVDFFASAADILQSGTVWALILMLPVGAVGLVAISAWLFARRAFAAAP